MTYKETLQAVDTAKALKLLGIENKQSGAYLIFKCPDLNCKGSAIIKAYGDKKNLFYCPTCKGKGHVITLVMKVKELDWNAASEFLTKATSENQKLTEELNIDYELVYHDFIKDKSITAETCKVFGIGVPKGKTMLSGCVAFTVINGEGKRIAYYGIKMRDGKPLFHKSFNPELYLYGYYDTAEKEIVYFTTDIFKCVQFLQDKKYCLCNYGLPYLSPVQLDFLQDIDKLVFIVEEPVMKTIAIQLAQYQRGFYRFEH